ncbi:MAG: acyl-CoA thioesterase [Desulforhopalus sp.]
MEHQTEIKIRGYHADFYGHVNNARFLEFFEEDRWALLGSKIDLQQWVKRGLTFLVVNINVNYRQAVPVGETLVAETTLVKIGARSAVLKQVLLFKVSGQIAADALVTFVVTDSSGRATPLAGPLLEEIEKLR